MGRAGLCLGFDHVSSASPALPAPSAKQRGNAGAEETELRLAFEAEKVQALFGMGKRRAGCEVTEIHLGSDLDVNGTLDEEIGKLPSLRHFSLAGTKTEGNLDSFANSPQLQVLLLSNTQVSGDLRSLANSPQLQQLDLDNTQVSGDISSLASSPQLQVLLLSNTQVSGDISSLANSPQLRCCSSATHRSPVTSAA
ncbi:unnamed protein product [Effrenium voratum]|nr:unnamed protein product [Effrenium voratum]